MKYITMATESRIKKAEKMEGRFSQTIHNETEIGTLAWILDEIKSGYGWYGATVAEAKKFGQQFDNADQIKGRSSCENVLYGWTCKYPNLVNYSNTLGLNSLTIKDFNGLVKAVLSDAM